MSGLSEEALWTEVQNSLKKEIGVLIDDDDYSLVVPKGQDGDELRLYTKNVPGLAMITIHIRMDKSKGVKYIDEKVPLETYLFVLIID